MVSGEDRVFVYGIASATSIKGAQSPVYYREKEVEKLKYIEKEKEKAKWWNFGLKKFSFSMFYTFSFGTFYERVNNVSAESTQNSPLTLGASVNFNINNENFSYSGSTYWSMLNAAMSTSQESSSINNKADIPWEYGFTSYIEYSGFKYAMKPYIGFDLESFSTFNTDEIAVNQQVQVEARTHTFLYGTVGFSLFTTAFGRPFFIKIVSVIKL